MNDKEIRAYIRGKLGQVVFITEVDYDANKECITKVRVNRLNGKSATTEIITRNDVVSRLKAERSVSTLGFDTQGNPHCAPVDLYPREGIFYIRTAPNISRFDNLGELPPITR